MSQSETNQGQSNRKPPDAARRCPRINIRELTGRHREVVIRHADQEYRLRITRNGKLILTK